MKKLLKSLVLVVAVLSIIGCSSNTDDSKVKIGIVQLVQHPSLDTINDSIMKQLEADGYKDGDNATIYYQNAGGDISTINTIVNKFKEDKVDVIIAIATPAAQVAMNVATDIPVVFAAVSDPIGAGLLDDLNKPNNNVTGTSDEIQVDLILDLAVEMYPSTKNIGFLYNASEANSESNLKKVKDYAKTKGLNVIEASVSNSADVQIVTESLVNKVDIIFTPNDNTIASTMSVVSDVTSKNKIPLFVGADSMVNDGGLATVGIDYEELGKASAQMVKEILDGKKVEDIPVKVFKTDLNVYINETVAKEIGFDKISDIENNHKSVIKIK